MKTFKNSVMKYATKQIIASLALVLFANWFSVSQTEAATFSAGQVFNHDHYIQNNNSCAIFITRVTKSWTSTGNVIQRVDNRAGAGVKDSSTQQTGSFSSAINNYRLEPGARVSAILDFYTNPNNSGSVTSTVDFQYTSNCGPCEVGASLTSNIVGPAANCTQSEFAANSANPGDSVNFTWNINNPGGQVRLTCGGAGQAGIFDANVPASGTRSITVPAGADTSDVISCSLRVGANNLCGDNLTISPNPSIKIDKTDQNADDQDGTQQNDTQTINGGGDAVFKIKVTNNGNEPLKNVVITDAESPACNRTAAQTQSLYAGSTFAPGASFSYNCRANGVTPASFTDGDNDISVTGKGNTSNQNVNDADPSAVIFVNVGDAGINLLKWAANPNDKDGTKTGGNAANDTQSIDSGSSAVFRIQVKNTEDVALENVRVTDNNASQCALTAAQVNQILTNGTSPKSSVSNVTKLSGTNNNNILEPNEGFEYDCTQPNVVDGYTNMAVTIGDPVNGNPSVSDNDKTEVLICSLTTCPPNGAPSINIDKTDQNPADKDGTQRNDTQRINEGSEAVFRITVTNNGREALRDVVVTDSESPSCARSAAQTRALYPGDFFDRGESFTYTCSRGNVTMTTFADGDNDAQVNGVGRFSGTLVNDEDPSVVVVDPSTPQPACSNANFNPDVTTPNSTSVFSWTTTNAGANVNLECTGNAGFTFSGSVPATGSQAVIIPRTAANNSTVTCEIKKAGNGLCNDVLTIDTGSGPFCGDGIVNQATEQCDDGNNNDTDACSNTCQNVTPPYAIDVLKWAANPNDKDGVKTGNNNNNDTQTVESITDNNLDKAIFRIRVKNTGANALKNVQVEDVNAAACALNANQVRDILMKGTTTKTTISNISVQNEVTNNALLEPGEQFTYDCVQDGTLDSYTNTAKAIGTPVDDSTDVMDTDPSEVVVCNGSNCPSTGTDPSIQIDKLDANLDNQDFDNVVGNDSQLIIEGSNAGFTINVTNNGAEALKEVVITDSESPQCARTAAQTQNLYPGTEFDPGESFSYNCRKLNAIAGDFDGANGQGSVDGKNDARVDAKSVVDDASVNDEDPSEVLFIAQCTEAQGQITINKDDSTPGQADTDGDDTQLIPNGGTATFTISVANPGTNPISEVMVTDALSPSCGRTKAEFMTLLGAIGNNDNKLDAGEVVTYTCTQDNVTADFTNSAMVTGINPNIPCVVTDTDTTEVVVSGTTGDPFCGDGIIQTPEQCDNGPLNGTAGNSCNTSCETLDTPGGGGDPIESAVGTCTFNPSNGAAQCTRKKPVEDVSDPLWVSYRLCREGINPPRHTVVGTLEQACALDWAEDQGLVLCGANIVGTIDPFGTPTNGDILAQCDPIIPYTPGSCTPVNTPCPECFKAGNSITKQVRPADLSDVLAATATVAKGENAKYEVTVGVDGFDNSTHQILDAKIRVYDHTIPTESGNIFNREGIEDGDGNSTWKWCDENNLCPEYGEYFYQVVDATKIAQLNATGEAEFKVHYDMDTAVASTHDTANIMNVAYAMIYYTYAADDGFGNITTGNTIAGFGQNVCQPTPPTQISQLAQGTIGATANVNIIRPFIKARAGNAGYFGGGSSDKAFADQNNILSPTDEDQNYGLTLTDDTNVYTGAEQGNANDLAEFQDQKDDFYTNIDAAANGTVTIGGEPFSQVGDSQVYQFNGTSLDVSAVAGISESATFIITNGDLTVNNNFAFTNSGVFAAFIVRQGDLLIDKDVASMAGMYLVEQGEIKSSPEPDVSNVQLIVSGNMFGDLGHLLAYRRYIGNTSDIEPSIEINFDLRLLNNTPPMLEQFLGEGWREDIQE